MSKEDADPATNPSPTTAPASGDTPMPDATTGSTDPRPISEEEAAVNEQRRVLLEKGAVLHAQWKQISCAYHFPSVEPSVPMGHWDYVLREGKWMAEDFMQERLWKQAASVKMCLEALKAGGRTRLKTSIHGPTKVTNSVEVLDSEFGKARPSPAPPSAPAPAPAPKTGKEGGAGARGGTRRESRQVTPPLKDQDKGHASSSCNGKAGESSEDHPLGPLDPLLSSAFCSPSFPPLLFPQHDLPSLISTVTQSLEQDDVKRLSRFAVASATYNAAYNSVRWKPSGAEEEEAFKSRMATGRRVRKGPSLLMEGHEGFEDRRARAPVGGGGGGGSFVRRAEDPNKQQQQQQQKKRKAQQRDLQGFVDEEEYPNKSRFGSRDDLTRAAGPRAGGGSGLMRAPRAGGVGGGMGMPPHGMHPPGMGMAGGGLRGLPALPPLQRMVAVRTGAVPPTPPSYRIGQVINPPLGPGERLVQWSPMDDHTLASIATEFGCNWALVADVLRTCTLMQGQFRRHDMCRVRYMALQRALLAEMQGKSDPSEVPDPASMPVNMLQPVMTKPQAKEILSASLPINIDVQRQHIELISSLALRSRQRRGNERQNTREAQRFRPDVHPSHQKASTGVFQLTVGRVLTPSEIVPFDDPPPPAPPPAILQQQQQQQQHRSSVTLGQNGGGGGGHPSHPHPHPQPPSASAAPSAPPAPLPSSLPPSGCQGQGQGQGQGLPLTAGNESSSLAPHTNHQAQPQPHPNSNSHQQPSSSAAPSPSPAAAVSNTPAPQGGELPSSFPPLPPGMTLQQMQLFMSKMPQMMQQMNNGGGGGAPFAHAAAMAQGAVQQPQPNQQPAAGNPAFALQAIQAMVQQQQQQQNNQRQK